MQKIYWINPIVFATVILFLATDCKKEEPVSLTQAASNLSKTGATLNGTVNPNGVSTTVTFEYGTTTGYDTSVTAIQSPVQGNGITNVSADISGLTIGTTYHFRVKAENSHWTVYGSDMEFEYGYPPTVTTLAVTNSKSTGVTLNGNVNAGGFPTIVTFEYGTTTSYGQEVTAEQNFVTGKSITNVSADISGLTIGTTYHFRIKAENSFGPVYGNDTEFEFGCLSFVTALEATNLTSSTTTLNCTVNVRGSPTVVTFEYGTTTSYGQEVTAEQNPVTGNDITNVSADISGLTPCTTYHCRVKAENSCGKNYGSDTTFYLVSPPTLTTTSIYGITATSAISGGYIAEEGCSQITDRGVYFWKPNQGRPFILKDDSTGVGRFIINLTGLQPSTRYYLYSYARNKTDIIYYGNIICFTTNSQ